MQAVILAAGLGARMGSLTKETPKPMLKIHEKTLLEHNLSALPEPVDEIVIVIGYRGGLIRNFLGNAYHGKPIIYIEQKELKGTGHAVSLCKDVLHGRFLVLMGDDLYAKADLEKLVSQPLGILVQELDTDTPNDFHALVHLDGEGRVQDIIERQRGTKGALSNCGAYVLDMLFFKYPLVSAGNQTDEYGLPQTFLQMIRAGAEMKVIKASWWHKVTSPEDLELYS